MLVWKRGRFVTFINQTNHTDAANYTQHKRGTSLFIYKIRFWHNDYFHYTSNNCFGMLTRASITQETVRNMSTISCNMQTQGVGT